MKVLRPLRVISRNQGLRISIEALGMALGSILNVIIVSVLFYCMFGIIGVNYFKGRYYDCVFDSDQKVFFANDLSMHNLTTATPITDDNTIYFSKWTCINLGGAWKQFFLNFDSIF